MQVCMCVGTTTALYKGFALSVKATEIIMKNINNPNVYILVCPSHVIQSSVWA